MKKITLFTILLFTIFSCSSISPSNLNYFSKKTGGNVQNTREQMDGIASWYGPNFHNKKTANGEIYNQNAYTVAHRILPLGSIPDSRLRFFYCENLKNSTYYKKTVKK